MTNGIDVLAVECNLDRDIGLPLIIDDLERDLEKIMQISRRFDVYGAFWSFEDEIFGKNTLIESF